MTPMTPPLADPSFFSRRAGLLSLVLGVGLMLIGLALYATAQSAPIEELLKSGDPKVQESIDRFGVDTMRTMILVIGVLIVAIGFTGFGLGLWQLNRGGLVSAILLCVVNGLVTLFTVLQVLAAVLTGGGGLAGLAVPLMMCVGFGVALNWSVRAAIAASKAPPTPVPLRPTEISPLALAAQAPLSAYYVEVARVPEPGRCSGQSAGVILASACEGRSPASSPAWRARAFLPRRRWLWRCRRGGRR